MEVWIGKRHGDLTRQDLTRQPPAQRKVRDGDDVITVASKPPSGAMIARENAVLVVVSDPSAYPGRRQAIKKELDTRDAMQWSARSLLR